MNLNRPEEFLILNKKSTDFLFEHIKTNRQDTLLFRLNESNQRFPFTTPLELEEEEWMISKTKLEVFNLYF